MLARCAALCGTIITLIYEYIFLHFFLWQKLSQDKLLVIVAVLTVTAATAGHNNDHCIGVQSLRIER